LGGERGPPPLGGAWGRGKIPNVTA
jgi:hypothetical protein